MWTLSKQSRQLAMPHSQLESEISERKAEMKNLSQRLLKVQDEERRKRARDLHDSTGQTLAALKISVALLAENHKQDPSTMALVPRSQPWLIRRSGKFAPWHTYCIHRY